MKLMYKENPTKRDYIFWNYIKSMQNVFSEHFDYVFQVQTK